MITNRHKQISIGTVSVTKHIQHNSAYHWRALRLVLKSSYDYNFRHLEVKISFAPSVYANDASIDVLFQTTVTSQYGMRVEVIGYRHGCLPLQPSSSSNSGTNSSSSSSRSSSCSSSNRSGKIVIVVIVVVIVLVVVEI